MTPFGPDDEQCPRCGESTEGGEIATFGRYEGSILCRSCLAEEEGDDDFDDFEDDDEFEDDVEDDD